MKRAGVKVMFSDDDSKLHQKKVHDAWAEFGITVWPGAWKTSWDRDDRGVFPVDFTVVVPLDQTIHNTWKNPKPNILYARWNARRQDRKRTRGFYNDVKSSWDGIPQQSFQNAIDAQLEIHQAICKI